MSSSSARRDPAGQTGGSRRGSARRDQSGPAGLDSAYKWKPPKGRRRWPWVLLVIFLLLAGGLVLAAPYIGRWYLLNRVLPAVGKRFLREITVRRAEVRYGRVVIEGLAVRGAADKPDRPLLRLRRVTAAYRVGALLRGRVIVPKMTLEEPRLVLWRRKDKTSNFTDIASDLIAQLRGKKGKRKGKGGGRLRRRIENIEVKRGHVDFSDGVTGVKLRGRLKTRYQRGGNATVVLLDAHLEAPQLPNEATFESLRVTVKPGTKVMPPLHIAGGRTQLLRSLVISGVTGTVQRKASRVLIDLAGSYGGASAKLWSAKGWLAPRARRGHVAIEAKRFKLARIRQILRTTPVIRPEKTEVSGQLTIDVAKSVVAIDGGLAFRGLNLFHPKIARQPVLGLALATKIGARYDWVKDTLALQRATFDVRGVKATLEGSVARLRTSKPLVQLSLVAPPMPCQKVLDAFPPSLVPHLAGFKLKGRFSLKLSARVDFADLDKTRIGGRVRYRRCKVVEAPDDHGYKRLLESFEHTVEPSPGQTLTFTVGKENDDFVPYKDVSQHIINAFLTTEDGAFFRHRGFIHSQFAVAIKRNLKRGGFRLGASTISMQMVKNVLLSHEKTFSRKLQELFLTWYLEKHLSKQRIMEIYLNAIEFGPSIYGVGAAARHYFNKDAKDITVLEAAFFASILPSPRRRYIQYCRGELSKTWDRWVRRILRFMYARGRVSEVDMQAAKVEKIVFVKPENAPSERDCAGGVKRLREAWRDEARRRLRQAVLAAAPHQLALYMAKFDAKPKKKKRRRRRRLRLRRRSRRPRARKGARHKRRVRRRAAPRRNRPKPSP